MKRQKLFNKLATTFSPTVYKVVTKKRNGSEVTVENPSILTQYRQNVTHVKKFDVNIKNADDVLNEV